jgi:hypothetical protein
MRREPKILPESGDFRSADQNAAVRVDGAHMMLKDWAALEKLANPDPLIDDDTV